MVLPEQWPSEVAKGFDAPALARAMIERGLIVPAGDGKAAKPVKVPEHGTVRLYVLAPGIIGDVEGTMPASRFSAWVGTRIESGVTGVTGVTTVTETPNPSIPAALEAAAEVTH
jgi:hypothetical protein